MIFLLFSFAMAQLLEFSTVPTSYAVINPELQFSSLYKKVNQNRDHLLSVKYLVDPYDPQNRKIISLICTKDNNLEIKDKPNHAYQAGSCDKAISHHTQETYYKNGLFSFRNPLERMNSFDIEDFENIKNINSTFFNAPIDYGTFSLHHGRKTEKVIVFIHGFMNSSLFFLKAAQSAYSQGYNIILATLPGHENQRVGNKPYIGEWLLYSEYLNLMARQYGNEVIIVGHSLGGNLALHMADQGLVKKIILLQPLIKINPLAKKAFSIANSISPKSRSYLNFIAHLGFRQGNRTQDVLPIMREALSMDQIPLGSFSPDVQALVFLSHVDPVVSTRQALSFLKTHLPQAQIHTRVSGHMWQPDYDYWNDVRISNFVELSY